MIGSIACIIIAVSRKSQYNGAMENTNGETEDRLNTSYTTYGCRRRLVLIRRLGEML
jgi:hypothetical protein